jgi:ribonuclease P protein component
MATRFSFPRTKRIRKRAEFLRIQESPVRVSTRHLLFLLARGASAGVGDAVGGADRLGCAEPGGARLGVVASRKVGPAVARNRAKRLVREAFRLHPEVFPAGLDVVVIVRPGTDRVRLADIEGELIGAKAVLAKRARQL